MVLDCYVFGARAYSGCLHEIDAALIVLVDCAVYNRGVFVERNYTSQFTKETNERYDVSEGL